jgi:hypothetical protein
LINIFKLKSSLIENVHYPPLAGEADQPKENFKWGWIKDE